MFSVAHTSACGFARSWRVESRALVILLTLLILTSQSLAADLVERRGDEPPLRGQVLEVTDAGIWIRTETGASRWISWDRVRSVEASSALLQERADEFRTVSDDLWRGRTRLERSDAAMAEPIFAKYFERYRGHTNETALVVAEGLLRSYLARDARVQALIPALEVARLRAAKVSTISYTTLPRVIDDETLLCPWLPPVWSGSLGIAGLEQAVASYESNENEVVATIAALYRRSIEREMNGSDSAGTLPRTGAVRHAGVELLRDLVASLEPGDGRRAARVRLERRINSGELGEHGAWIEAWARYHVGRAMLDERDELSRQRGLIHLAHVPSRFGASQPYLAGLALAHLQMWHQVDAEVVASLKGELERRYPNHPALQETFINRGDSADNRDDRSN